MRYVSGSSRVDNTVESTRSANKIVNRRISPRSGGAANRSSASAFSPSTASTCPASAVAVTRSPRLLAATARSSSSSIDASRSGYASPFPREAHANVAHLNIVSRRVSEHAPYRARDPPGYTTRTVAKPWRYASRRAPSTGSMREGNRTDTEPRDELITVQAAADRLAVGRWMVYQLIWDRRVKSVQIGRCRRIVRQSFDDYLSGLIEGAA